jgi:hypothetical protein
MRKFLITTCALIAMAAPTFAEQSEEGMKLREMRRAEFIMMKQMMEANMGHMKAQEEMMKHLSEMLDKMILDCGDKNTRDGQQGC